MALWCRNNCSNILTLINTVVLDGTLIHALKFYNLCRKFSTFMEQEISSPSLDCILYQISTTQILMPVHLGSILFVLFHLYLYFQSDPFWSEVFIRLYKPYKFYANFLKECPTYFFPSKKQATNNFPDTLSICFVYIMGSIYSNCN
jgi:hypothetical protein